MNTQTHAHDEQRIKHITMNQLYMNDESQCSGPVGRPLDAPPRKKSRWPIEAPLAPGNFACGTPLEHPWAFSNFPYLQVSVCVVLT